MRICEQNNSADTKVCEGEQGGASGTRAEVPLVCGADSGEAAVPLQPMEDHGGAEIYHRFLSVEPTVEQVNMPKGVCDTMRDPHWSSKHMSI